MSKQQIGIRLDSELIKKMNLPKNTNVTAQFEQRTLTGELSGKTKTIQGKIANTETDNEGNLLYDVRYIDAKGNERSKIVKPSEIIQNDSDLRTPNIEGENKAVIPASSPIIPPFSPEIPADKIESLKSDLIDLRDNYNDLTGSARMKDISGNVQLMKNLNTIFERTISMNFKNTFFVAALMWIGLVVGIYYLLNWWVNNIINYISK